MVLSCLYLFVPFIVRVSGLSLPPPTGPYNVGTKPYVLRHTTTNDTVAPEGVSKSVLVNVYYPTHDEAPAQKYIWDELGTAYDVYFGVAHGTFSNITATLAMNGKPLSRREHDKLRLPTLFFGPAMAGPPTRFFTGLISEMASRGYPVVTVDHPWEAPYIQYPNGTGFVGKSFLWNPCPEVIDDVQAYRLADNSAVLDALPKISKELGVPLDLRRFAFFGHSLGGSAAVSQLLVEKNRTTSHSKKFLGAINIDGTFFGIGGSNSSSLNTRVPTLLLSSDMHDPFAGHDPTWPLFESFQSSWTKSLRIVGHTNHSDYSDLIFLKQANGFAGGEGAITAERFLQVSRTVVGDFFEMLVGKGEGVLKGSAEVQQAFPEVSFDYNGTGNPCTPPDICWPPPPPPPEVVIPSCESS
ncbi:hypothetical protein DPSP01_001879 [Paraphaeosphaeria sporulosa]|uniref:1-alkyl-2-acetylglycerophosphocholine esterase n=1 Tax=Paraphaeosphaeria sporulosa TaxID=1460663 RepID=A0A177C4Z5_9PLEO|nr:uncharacterized protein CC84DRAFT_218587 [Paraphaeosphaeria sporulosa]OAG01787.1 hypothetical protein CC84DRAFT_218587 [Paraphaeosphaeria sporulosa]